ncbi:Oidioi.mRNA.OKI2018_I69.XSR.g14571.t1.cds [Oikopleura dioica]|uniref:Oidioi.mRNA.OKI2018_I69.XSR.g14571.t1.cds n=1 Tax=Oikopleura dioica TaxID=34765 RepID=A0ABN7SJ51_OIKDI|nr:Oidioi.mRNA.OKI2018_I69.XSR.g14571.t1.cds [Oikopleura dioica]
MCFSDDDDERATTQVPHFDTLRLPERQRFEYARQYGIMSAVPERYPAIAPGVIHYDGSPYHSVREDRIEYAAQNGWASIMPLAHRRRHQIFGMVHFKLLGDANCLGDFPEEWREGELAPFQNHDLEHNQLPPFYRHLLFSPSQSVLLNTSAQTFAEMSAKMTSIWRELVTITNSAAPPPPPCQRVFALFGLAISEDINTLVQNNVNPELAIQYGAINIRTGKGHLFTVGEFRRWLKNNPNVNIICGADYRTNVSQHLCQAPVSYSSPRSRLFFNKCWKEVCENAEFDLDLLIDALVNPSFRNQTDPRWTYLGVNSFDEWSSIRSQVKLHHFGLEMLSCPIDLQIQECDDSWNTWYSPESHEKRYNFQKQCARIAQYSTRLAILKANLVLPMTPAERLALLAKLRSFDLEC